MSRRTLYDPYDHIIRNRYYLWFYKPDCKRRSTDKWTPSGKFLYPICICGVTFYSSYHAKVMRDFFLGTKAKSTIHIARGCDLLAQGYYSIPKAWQHSVYYKGRRWKISRWFYPYKTYIQSRSRFRTFSMGMAICFKRRGVTALNHRIDIAYYDEKYRIKDPFREKLLAFYKFIIPEICKALQLDPAGVYFTKSGLFPKYEGPIPPSVQEKGYFDKEEFDLGETYIKLGFATRDSNGKLHPKWDAERYR